MIASRRAITRHSSSALPSPFVFGFCLALAAGIAASPARAQSPTQPEARVIVVGEGSVALAPDYAEIRSGVTTRGKTAKEATDANAKAMTAVIAALTGSGIARNDIQTSRFSLQPVYVQQSGAEPKLSGFSTANQVLVKIRDVSQTGDILDRLVGAGATDIGNIQFLNADPSKALDQAREAAFADARRKAELYAKASGLVLGRVAWISEESAALPAMPMAAMRAAVSPASVPIASGEETMNVRITVGFGIAP